PSVASIIPSSPSFQSSIPFGGRELGAAANERPLVVVGVPALDARAVLGDEAAGVGAAGPPQGPVRAVGGGTAVDVHAGVVLLGVRVEGVEVGGGHGHHSSSALAASSSICWVKPGKPGA